MKRLQDVIPKIGDYSFMMNFKDLILKDIKRILFNPEELENLKAYECRAVIAILIIYEVDIGFIEAAASTMKISVTHAAEQYSEIVRTHVSKKIDRSGAFKIDDAYYSVEEFFSKNYATNIENREKIVQTIDSLNYLELRCLPNFFKKSLTSILIALGATPEVINRFCLKIEYEAEDIMNFILEERSRFNTFIKYQEFIDEGLIDWQLSHNVHPSGILFLDKTVSSITDFIEKIKYVNTVRNERDGTLTPLYIFFDHFISGSYSVRRQFKCIPFNVKDLESTDFKIAVLGLAGDERYRFLELLNYENIETITAAFREFGPFEVPYRMIVEANDEQVSNLLEAISQSAPYKIAFDKYNTNTIMSRPIKSNVTGVIYVMYTTGKVQSKLLFKYPEMFSCFLQSGDNSEKAVDLFQSCGVSLKEALELIGG